ncbi:MAG TPA: heme lyase CcmF/NrfE family subunit [Thermoanaerobaculia bacterium]|nr:heme lyase CcmF/NrfE family subunit [Thermoanaerobaculia bacterium]
MMSHFGQGLVLLALLLCAIGSPIGFAAGRMGSERGLAWTRRIALGFAATMLLANVLMEVALLRHDFSVSYVAQVGSLATPPVITAVSLWSSLEGSILFWGLVLGLYTAGVAVLQRRGHEDYLAYTLATMLAVGLFFSFLIAGPANPFAPTPPPVPVDGPGPNPLLQNHVLMIIHPPMLYLGYVGMTVPFAMAVAALLRGQLGPTWLQPLRNWLLVPTGFLTAGIMLGGWWSYEVLGWGGYWAWDPVENASFLPWLTGIAALHSAVVLERKGTLKAWTVVLVLITFLLTILGTFLTRSGVVNSVHSFTQSPIGPAFLAFLALALLFVVVLLSLRVDKLVGDPARETLVAREGAFFVNNLLLVAVMFTVLIGTLHPVFAESIRGVKVSVGEPYFNRMAVPLFLSLLLLIGVGPALPWGTSDRRQVRRALLAPLPAAAAALAVALALGARSGGVLLTCAFAGYALWVTADQGSRAARRRAKKGETVARAARTAILRAPRRLGAYVVHFGVIVTFVAVAVSSTFQTEREGTLAPGQALEIEGYALRLTGVAGVQQPHRFQQRADVALFRGGRQVGTLAPALNIYPTQMDPLATPAVRTGLTHDLYLTLMGVGADGSIGLRAIVTPGVMWIWAGVLVMVAGTALCLVPPRRAMALVEAPRTQTARAAAARVSLGSGGPVGAAGGVGAAASPAAGAPARGAPRPRS